MRLWQSNTILACSNWDHVEDGDVHIDMDDNDVNVDVFELVDKARRRFEEWKAAMQLSENKKFDWEER